MERYNSFNGLRAIGAFGIAMMHYLVNMNDATAAALRHSGILYERAIPFFTMFVFMFFILSAFSMCCGYYHKFDVEAGRSSFDAERFYNKRYSRIFPFFALLVLIDLLMNPTREELYQGFADLTLAFNFLPNPDIHVIGVGWFVGVVFVFYMLFPWFVYILKDRRRAWFAWGVALAMHLLVVNYFLTEQFVLPSEIINYRHNIVFSFPFFISGGLLYIYRKPLGNAKLRFAYLLAAVVCTALQIHVAPKIFGENILFILVIFIFWILYAMTGGFRMLKTKLLDNRIMTFLSALSMEIYLCHMMMFRLLEKAHLERMIENPQLLYWTYCLLGISLAVAFSFLVKNIAFPAIGKRIPALSFLR